MKKSGREMNIIKRLYSLYLKRYKTAKWARILGVSVGENTWISPTVVFSSEPYLISIGKNVQVTNSVAFLTHGGGGAIRSQYPDFDCFGKIVVEDYVYIGSNSIIMPGVTIGKGALVAAGSVITKSVAPHTVVGGNPARFICTTDEYIDKNMKYNVGSKGLTYDEKKHILQSLPEEKFIRK